jgi:hypothetical protein
MTAEVAIANSSAVALAADSAVTIGGQKIYNSALKLFALSKVAPVGVMIYGNARLMSVPWETLIKSFRAKLKGRKYEKLEEYASDFISYLTDNPAIFPKEAQQEWLERNVSSYFSNVIRAELFEKIHEKVKIEGETSNEYINEALSEVVDLHHNELKSEHFAAGMNKKFNDRLREKYLEVFKKIRQVVFENIQISGRTATKLAAFLHTKQIFSSSVSGLVVAGYGESDMYPVVVSYDVGGVIDNKLKYRKNESRSHSIRSGNECRIIAFAQEDMATTFMNGVNPQVYEFLDNYLIQMFNRLPELLEKEKIGKEEKKKFTSKVDKLLEKFTDDFIEHMREKHAVPVLSMVTSLPKDELAAMAESLVNLTAFKRRITQDIETVGGPVDVAVISKGDGFIWVKRKHYFPADLNQHFFANYFRGISDDKQEK